jgi:HEAT repeat protein
MLRSLRTRVQGRLSPRPSDRATREAASQEEAEEAYTRVGAPVQQGLFPASVESERVDLRLLTTIVIILYGISAVLILLSLFRHRLQVRRERRHERTVELLRAPVEAYLLDGRPLPRSARRHRLAILDLALRYAGMIRGKEADRLVTCLETEGIIDDLVKDLSARSPWRRAEAAESLGRLRVERVVPALIETLEDPSEDVRTVAARALAAVGDPRAIPPLAQALRDPSRWTVSLIAENLMMMGPSVVPPLLGLLAHDDYNVRVSAVQILGEIRDPTATPALASVLLGDDRMNLRARAAAALGRLGGPVAEGALLVAIDDEHWEVRAQAAKGLGRIAKPAFAHVLARAMPDPSWWVRANCAEALSRLGEPGRAELERMAEHPDPYVREQATAALETFGLRALRPAYGGFTTTTTTA